MTTDTCYINYIKRVSVHALVWLPSPDHPSQLLTCPWFGSPNALKSPGFPAHLQDCLCSSLSRIHPGVSPEHFSDLALLSSYFWGFLSSPCMDLLAFLDLQPMLDYPAYQ